MISAPPPPSAPKESEVQTPASEQPATPPTPAAPEPEPTPAPSGGFKDRIPSNWYIVALKDGMIRATNSTSGETFEGNLSDFNKGLRG